MGKTVLLTGPPRVGKTTLIKRVIDQLGVDAGGFYTSEMRDAESKQRIGFKINTLDGNTAILASVDIQGQPRISKYGVDVEAVETVGVSSIRSAIRTKDLIVIDEIGPMELLSDAFCDAVNEALNSEIPVLGTIVQRSRPFSDQIKARPDVTVIEVSYENRDELTEEIRMIVQIYSRRKQA